MLIALFALAVSAETFGRVVVAVGSVTASREGEAARTLKVGDTVYKGEKVATDPEGRAKLLLEDRSVLSLGPKTEMELVGVRTQEVPKTSVKLLFGRLWANVQKLVGSDTKFDVTTPNAVAGVRGTSFVADVTGGNSTFTVAGGNVLVSSGGNQQMLGALQQILANGNGLGGVTTLTAQQLAQVIAGLSASGSLSSDSGSRMDALNAALHGGGGFPVLSNDPFNSNVNLPPVNIDPQQTTQTTLIHGHVQVVNP